MPLASGTYTPTTPAPGASPPGIVGLFANGGSITAGQDPTAVTVNATAASASYGLNAINGGTIGPLDVAGVTTAASSSPAVYALKAGSTITLTLLPSTSPALATIVTTGDDSVGVLASSGGSVVLSGGSVMTIGELRRAGRLLRLNFGDGNDDYDDGRRLHHRDLIRRG